MNFRYVRLAAGVRPRRSGASYQEGQALYPAGMLVRIEDLSHGQAVTVT